MPTIDLRTAEGRGYVRALVDASPTLSERADMMSPLTGQWKRLIRSLLDLLAASGPTPVDPLPTDPQPSDVPDSAPTTLHRPESGT